MYVEIFIDTEGNIEYFYKRVRPAPEGYKNTDAKQIIEVHDPETEYDDLTGTAESPKWVFNREKWLNGKIRPMRDARIKKTDWTQLPDVDLTDTQKTAWQIYRQKLRDITDTIEYGNEQWPEEPK